MSKTTEILDKQYLDPVFLEHGIEVYTYEYFDKLRNDKKLRKRIIAPNPGSQEKALACESDLIIYTGLRGVGKSGYLCMTNYDRLEYPGFYGMILRKEINDAKNPGGIVDTSKRFYKEFGKYKESAQNMTWDFNAGGSLKFEYYSDSYQSFQDRIRGRESSRISVDELTQMKFNYFRFLFTVNRNPDGLKNQVVGTCNPDGDSWVYRFVGGKYISDKGEVPKNKWLDDEGYPIPEMDGVELYFYVYGDRADQTYWGTTREEVVRQGRKDMLKDCSPDDRIAFENGTKRLEDVYVLSCTFFTGYTSENRMIDTSDYYKRLSMLSPEERARDLGGRWMRNNNSDALIDMDDMDAFYNNAYQTSSQMYVTADISYGDRKDSDPSVFFLWRGFHLEDVEVCRVGNDTLKVYAEQYLQKWGVSEENFCFDATGIGSGMNERFSNSMQCDYKTKAFDQREAKIGKMKQTISSYQNVKAQCYDNFANRMKARGYSVNKSLLYIKMDGKALIDHFNEEYIAVARDRQKDGKFQALAKREAVYAIGHSPNFIDALWQREYIELVKNNNKRKVKRSGAWLL